MRPIAEIQRDVQIAVVAAEQADTTFEMPGALWQEIQELHRPVDMYSHIAPALAMIVQSSYELLAEKDQRIAVLERRLRSLMFPDLFGDDEYPPMLPEFFGRN